MKAEIELDFPGLRAGLESGLQIINVMDDESIMKLDPDVLRKVGGMTMLCKHYATAVIFGDTDKIATTCRLRAEC